MITSMAPTVCALLRVVSTRVLLLVQGLLTADGAVEEVGVSP